MTRILLGAVPPIVLVLLWQAAKSAGLLPYSTVPAPVDVLRATGELAASGELLLDVGHTLVVTLTGWAIGSAAGLVLGVALGSSSLTWRWSLASVQVLRAVPAIAFVSITVIVLSQSMRMEIFITAWVAVWPVAISVMDGIRDVSPLHRDLAASLRLGLLQRLAKIELPSAAPTVFVALRLALGSSLALALVAEMVGNPAGIGYALVLQQLGLRPDAMFAYVITTGLLGLLLNALIQAVARFVPGASTGASGRAS